MVPATPGMSWRCCIQRRSADSTQVGVKSHIAQTYYAVDDITVMPSSRTYVQAHSGGTGTECIQMHNLTFEVNHAGTLLEGALVEITPNFGSGPPRTTYPDGTISYTVGAGPLSFVVSKSGYVTKSGYIDISGGATVAVALQAEGSGGGGGEIGDVEIPPFPPQDIFGEVVESPLPVSGGFTYTPSPDPTDSITVLVNGTFNPDSMPDWMQPGSAMYQAIAATFGGTIHSFHWNDSGVPDVLPPFYLGIVNGAFKLANVLHALPAGDVNIVAHSHGGNVAGFATWLTDRPIHRMIGLGVPVNQDLALRPSRNARSYRAPCLVSSWGDLIQVAGASITQQRGFIDNTVRAARSV